MKTPKLVNQAQTAASRLFASTVGMAVLFIILAAAVGSWRLRGGAAMPVAKLPTRETFMDCSMSATCAMP